MFIKSKMFAIVSMIMLAGGLGPAAAQESRQTGELITLASKDGTVVLTGELQGYEAGYYNIVVVGLGLVRVAEDLVTCQSSRIDCAALVGRS